MREGSSTRGSIIDPPWLPQAEYDAAGGQLRQNQVCVDSVDRELLRQRVHTELGREIRYLKMLVGGMEKMWLQCSPPGTTDLPELREAHEDRLHSSAASSREEARTQSSQCIVEQAASIVSQMSHPAWPSAIPHDPNQDSASRSGMIANQPAGVTSQSASVTSDTASFNAAVMSRPFSAADRGLETGLVEQL